LTLKRPLQSRQRELHNVLASIPEVISPTHVLL
jgi:hypothetical protein